MATPSIFDKITARVEKRDGPLPTQCWIWMGAKTKPGYGHVWDRRKYDTCHRHLWRWTHGPIPEGLWVLHKCDVRACCNPEHLFLGTRQDNMDDAKTKGRIACARNRRHSSITHPERLCRGDRHPARRFPERLPRGENHAHAVLTDKQVRVLRSMVDARGKLPRGCGVAIAKAWGISKQNVSAIARGLRRTLSP